MLFLLKEEIFLFHFMFIFFPNLIAVGSLLNMQFFWLFAEVSPFLPMKMYQNLISPHLLHFTEITGLIMMTLTEITGKYQISYIVS